MVTWYDYTTHQAVCLPAIGEVALCTLYHGDDVYRDVSVKITGEWKGDAVVGISELNPDFDHIDSLFDSVVRIEIENLRPLDANSIITPKPKRWTVQDQKAGKLPEVGDKYSADDYDLVCIFVDGLGDIWGYSVAGRVKCHAAKDIKPIETQAEKAQRLRSEWVETAIGETPVYAIAEHGYSKQLRIDVSAIYDAMLSGELKTPESTE